MLKIGHKSRKLESMAGILKESNTMAWQACSIFKFWFNPQMIKASKLTYTTNTLTILMTCFSGPVTTISSTTKTVNICIDFNIGPNTPHLSTKNNPSVISGRMKTWNQEETLFLATMELQWGMVIEKVMNIHTQITKEIQNLMPPRVITNHQKFSHLNKKLSQKWQTISLLPWAT